MLLQTQFGMYGKTGQRGAKRKDTMTIESQKFYRAKHEDGYFYVTRIEKRGTRRAIRYIKTDTENAMPALVNGFGEYTASETAFKGMISTRGNV